MEGLEGHLNRNVCFNRALEFRVIEMPNAHDVGECGDQSQSIVLLNMAVTHMKAEADYDADDLFPMSRGAVYIHR